MFLTRFDDLAAIYRDAQKFSSDKHVEFAPKYGAGSPLFEHHTTSLVFNDPPLHTRVRKLIMGALTRRAIADMEPGLITLVDSLLDGNIDVFKDALSHIILPASLLGYYSLAYISRMTRSFMLEQLSAEYVTTARVKGLSEWNVVWKHAFRNIRVQLITVIALSYAGLLEGSVLTEIIFSWPGIGSYITTALLSADMNAVLGGTVVVGLVFILLNIFSDLLYKVFDPRAK